MKRIALVLAATVGFAIVGTAQADEALAKSAGCLTCHNVAGAKKIGASFKDTAAKYKGKADADKTLLATIADAKKHPASKASDADKAKLIAWILAM